MLLRPDALLRSGTGGIAKRISKTAFVL